MYIDLLVNILATDKESQGIARNAYKDDIDHDIRYGRPRAIKRRVGNLA